MSAQGFLHLLTLLPSTFAFPLPLKPLVAQPETSLVPFAPFSFSVAASMCPPLQ